MPEHMSELKNRGWGCSDWPGQLQFNCHRLLELNLYRFNILQFFLCPWAVALALLSRGVFAELAYTLRRSWLLVQFYCFPQDICFINSIFHFGACSTQATSSQTYILDLTWFIVFLFKLGCMYGTTYITACITEHIVDYCFKTVSRWMLMWLLKNFPNMWLISHPDSLAFYLVCEVISNSL